MVMQSRRNSIRFASASRRLLAGTAIPLAVLAASAHAEPIVESSETDIVVSAAEASGSPVAVELSSTNGSVTATVTTVTGSAAAGERDYVVGLETLSGGNITGTFGSITGTGTGELLGLGAESYNGAIDLTVGTVDVSGAATAGISAYSENGTVSISADSVIARGTGVDSQGEFYEAVSGVSNNNSVTIDVGSAETFGQAGSAIGAIAGGTATITADSAVAHAEGVIVAYANAAGDASVDIGSVTLTAENGQGVYVTSAGGNATLAVDTIVTGDLAEAARVLAAEDINVTLGNVDAGGGLTARSTNGDTTVVLTGDLVGRTYGGMEATGQNVSVTMAEGSSITAAGTTWNGIFANGQQSVEIAATDIATQGQSIRATSALGSVSVETSGAITSATSNAISINAQSVNVAIGADSVVTGGAGSSVVAAGALNNGGGTATVVNDGSVIGVGGIGSGIGVTGAGDVSVTSNLVSLEGASDPVSAFVSAGISAVSNGGGNVIVDAATTEVGGQRRHGIYASATGAGTVTVAADATSSEGDAFAAINVRSDTGNISIDSGTLVSGGVGGKGIEAVSYNGGDIAIVSGDLTTSAEGVYTDGNGNQVFAEGIYADTVGAITIDSGSADIHGYGASAIVALAGDDVTISSDSIATHGDQTTALYAGTWEGDVVVESGSITTEGSYASAIGVSTDAGAVSVTSGTIDTVGERAFAIQGIGTTGVTVVSDTISVTGLNASGIIANTVDGNVSVTSGDITAARFGVFGSSQNGDVSIALGGNTLTGASYNSGFSYAARGEGQNVVITTAEGSTSTGANYGLSAVAGDSATIVNGGTAIATGNFGSGIHVVAPGAVSITSNAVQVTGAGAEQGVRPDGYRIDQGGIIVNGSDGAIMVDSGTVDVAGEARYGISVRGNGAIDISADEVTLASADSVAVVARGGAGDVSITTGQVTTTGASGVGVFADSTSGNIVVNAGTTRVENAGMQGNFTGDAVVATSDTGTVSVTSENAYSNAIFGTAVYAFSGGAVSLDSGVAETTGDGGVALFAQSGGGDASLTSGSLLVGGDDARAIRIAAANVATGVIGDVTALGANSSGILATGRVVDVTVDGTVQSTLTGLQVQGLETNVVINGAVSSTTGSGLISISPQGHVEVAAGGSVSGAAAGVVLLGNPQSGGFTQFYNSGTVQSVNGPAVAGVVSTPTSPPSDFYIQNNGVLAGGNGVAVSTAGGNDTLELTELSQITGIANLGGGDDRLVLDFNDDAAAGAVGKVVSTVNVEGLSVDSGSWIADGAQSIYDFVEIEEGATLTVVENAEGSLAVESGSVELNGVLNLDLSVDETEGDLGDTTIFGTGSLHLIGTATVELTDASGLQHTGGTFVENGGLLLTDVYGGDISTSGAGVFTLGEGGDFTGNLVNDGTFVFAQAADYDFVGDFSGTGLLEKQGNGRLTFAGFYGFEGTTSVLGGSVAFTGQLSEDTQLDLTQGTVDLSQVEGGTQTIAQLSGEGGSLQLGETQLVIDQSADTVFAGSLSGSGSLVKAGEGDLKLNGDGTGFTGTGQVSGGTLSVNGTYSNATFEVTSGGTLGGNGTVGSTFIQGGTLGAGNSIGTLTVAGNLAFTPASVLEVEVDPAGNADLIQVTGTATLGGAAVNVLAASGTYRPLTDYTILTAAGGVTGTFGSVTSNLAFLDPSLSYSANAVTLRLARNDIDFAAFGATSNQSAIGNLIESFGYGNALYNQALTLIDTDVAVSFASLTGDIYPAYGGAIVETAETLRRQTTGQMVAEGTYAWATGLYNQVESGDIELEGAGVAGGFGFGANGFSASAGLGIFDQGGGTQFSDGDVKFAIAQVAYDSPMGFSASAGAQFGWVEGDTRRQTTLGTIDQAVTGAIEGDYVQLFGELAYRARLAALTVEPFVGISHVSLDLDAVNETGAPTALAVAETERDVTFGRAGLRVSGAADSAVQPFVSAAYRRAWGDRASVATVGFAGTPGSALISAGPIARSGAELAAGVTVSHGAFDFEVNYDGMISKGFDSHGLSAGLKFRF